MRSIRILWSSGVIHFVIAACVVLGFVCNDRVGIFDWRKELAYLQHTLDIKMQTGECPRMWWSRPDMLSAYPAIRQTADFRTNPETMLYSPLTFLLPLLGGVLFAKMLVLVHFLIGAAGLWLLSRQLAWDGLQRRTALALFFFRRS